MRGRTMLTSVLRILATWLALLAVLAGAVAAGLQFGWFELPLPEIIERYRLPNSKFVEVDGVEVHYVDEGRGSPVVILHASFLSLRSWDAVAALLAQQHRVVRLDLSGAGLTGTDPSKRYGVDRNIDLVRGIMARLNLRSAALVGTSSGGISAFRMAARFPEQVDRLVLINSAGMPRTAATNPLRANGSPVRRWIESRLRSKLFWRDALTDNFVPPHRPANELVQMTYDMNRRAGGSEISSLYVANFSTGDPQTLLAQVKAPTLVLWGLENRTVMHLEADVFARWLSNAPALVKKYPGVGHYVYIEEPEAVSRDIADFLTGRLDAELELPCTSQR